MSWRNIMVNVGISLGIGLSVLSSGCVNIIPSLMPTVDAEVGISAEQPYPSHSVAVLDSTMSYIEAGDPDGPVIVLVHGNPTSSYLWRNIIPHLEGQGRVIAPDLIGMGQSGKPDIGYRFEDHMRYFDAFMETMAFKDVVLVLHDWGGAVGLDYAMRHQENIRAIAFMEAMVLPFKWREMAVPERILFRKMRSEAGKKLLIEENFFVEKLVPALSGRELTDVEMAYYRAPYLEPEDRLPPRMFPLEVPFDDDGEPADNLARILSTYEKLKRSELPLLLLTAEPGAVIPAKVAARLQSDLPHLETKSIGPGLHFIQESQPTAIGQALQGWVSTLPE